MWDGARDWSWGDLMHQGWKYGQALIHHTPLLSGWHVFCGQALYPNELQTPFSHKNPYLDGRICESRREN